MLNSLEEQILDQFVESCVSDDELPEIGEYLPESHSEELLEALIGELLEQHIERDGSARVESLFIVNGKQRVGGKDSTLLCAGQNKTSSSKLMLELEAIFRLVVAEVQLKRDKNIFLSRQELEDRFPDLRELFRDRLGGPSPHFLADRLIPEIEGERYRDLEFFEEGGQSLVFQAYDTRLKRHVLLKRAFATDIARPAWALNPDDRLEREAAFLAKLNHPNITTVHDIVTSTCGRPFLVMQKYRNNTLSQLIGDYQQSRSRGQNAKTKLNKLLDHFLKVCDTISYAHEFSIIHRDIKPDNVLVDEFGQTIVIDWGLARDISVRESTTDFRETLTDDYSSTLKTTDGGTKGYRAPEASSNIDSATEALDIHSLGGVLYCIFVGAHPSENEAARTKSMRQIPIGITAIVKKAMHQKSAERYRTVSEFREDVDAWLRHDCPQALQSESLFQTIDRLSRKHATALLRSLIGFVALLIVAIGGFALYLSRLQQYNRDLTNANAEKAQAIQAKASALTELDVANIELISAKDTLETGLAQANFYLANALWNDNRAPEALKILYQVPHKLRNIEWYLTKQQFLGNYINCFGHKSYIDSVAFSRDGSQVVSGADSARVWNAGNGQQLRLLDGPICDYTVAFSPDGTIIAAGCSDNAIRLWDSSTGKLVTKIDTPAPVRSLAFCPRGSHLASITASSGFGVKDSSLIIWRLESKTEVARVSQPSKFLHGVAFDPDGLRVVTGGNAVRLWDTDAKLLQELPVSNDYGGTQNAMGVAFSPDGSKVAAGCVDGVVRLWNLRNNSKLLNLRGHRLWVNSVQFSPDGASLVSGSGDCSVRLWDCDSGVQMQSIKVPTGEVTAVAFDPSGRFVAAGGQDCVVRILSIQPNTDRLIRFASGLVATLAYSHDGKTLASGGYGEHPLQLWDADTLTLRSNIAAASQTVLKVVFSPDDSWLASSGHDHAVTLWDVKTSKEIKKLVGHEDAVSQLAFSPDGTTLVSASDGIMKIWDIATGVDHKTIAAQAGKICAVAYSPRGTCVATSEYRRGSDNLIRLWDPRSGELITTIESDDFSFDLEFFPDGVRLASAQQSNVKIFNIETGEVRDFHASDTLVNDLAISRDGSRLIMSKFDRSVLVCDAQTGEILKTLQGDLVPNNKVALCPTGSQIASTGNEGSLVAWDARNETEYWLLDGHKNRIHDARFSDDFSMVFARDVMNQDLEWVLPKGIEEGLKVANANPSISSNGRYCVVPSGKNVIVADLEFKNSSYQKARREMLDVMSSSWHKSLAEHAREKGDSFAEAFHDTWMHRAKGHQKGHQELGSGR